MNRDSYEIEKVEGGYIVTSFQSHTTKKRVHKTFEEMVRDMALYFNERKIGETYKPDKMKEI